MTTRRRREGDSRRNFLTRHRSFVWGQRSRFLQRQSPRKGPCLRRWRTDPPCPQQANCPRPPRRLAARHRCDHPARKSPWSLRARRGSLRRRWRPTGWRGCRTPTSFTRRRPRSRMPSPSGTLRPRRTLRERATSRGRPPACTVVWNQGRDRDRHRQGLRDRKPCLTADRPRPDKRRAWGRRSKCLSASSLTLRNWPGTRLPPAGHRSFSRLRSNPQIRGRPRPRCAPQRQFRGLPSRLSLPRRPLRRAGLIRDRQRCHPGKRLWRIPG